MHDYTMHVQVQHISARPSLTRLRLSGISKSNMVAAMAGICAQPHCFTGQQGLQRHANHVPAPLQRRHNCSLRQQRRAFHRSFTCSAEPGSAPDAGPSEGAQAAPSTEAAPQMAPRDDDVRDSRCGIDPNHNLNFMNNA